MKMSEPFRVLLADCPWKFDDRLPGLSRGAERHYQTLSFTELKAFPLPPLADDCALFFWRVSSMPHEAIHVVRAWGFTPKTEIIWLKRTIHGKRHFGMGRITRAEHETCLIATRGKPKVLNHSVRSTFEAPYTRHSAKPEVFYSIIESLYSGPFAELFARHQQPGWVAFGNEVQ
jgi:N6-adenosine-specific RNA methylase IME4